jgi:outer membrane protein assembly factor BamB
MQRELAASYGEPRDVLSPSCQDEAVQKLGLGAFAVTVLVSTHARATPLEPLWEVKYRGDCDSAVFAQDGGLGLLHDRSLLRIDATDGTLAKPIALGSSQANVQHGRSWTWPQANAFVVDGVLAVLGGFWIGGYEPHTGAELWQREPDGSGVPTIVAAGNDLVIAKGSFLNKLRPGIQVEAADPHTGKPRWHVTLPYELGQLNHVAADASNIYVTSDGAVGLPHDVPALVALDRATGKQRWMLTDAHGFEVASSTAGPVAVIERKELRILEPATGKELRRVATDMRTFFVHGSHVFAATPRGVERFDLATGARRWTTALEAITSVNADDDTVFAVDAAAILHALDAASGAELASWGVADRQLVYLHAGSGAPSLVLCGNGKLTALSPTAPARPIEHATIEGEVVCRGCTGATGSPREVTVGTRTVKLSHRRFRVELDARGTLGIDAELPDLSVVTEGIQYDYHGCHTLLELTGKRHYRLTCTMSIQKNKL